MEDNWTPPSDAEVTDWSPPSDAQVVDEPVKKKVTPSPSQTQSSSNGLNLLSGVIPSGKALLTGQKGESVQIDQKPIDLTNAPIAEDESTRTDKFIRKPIDKKKVDEIYNLSKQNESLIDEFAKSHFVLDNLSQSEAIKQLNDLYAKREQAKDPQTAQAIDTQIEVIKSQPVEKQPSIQEAVLQNAQKYGSQPQDFNRPEIPMNPLTPNQILERNGMKTANTVGELHDRYIESANKLNELRPELDKTATELDAFKKEARTADFKTDKSGNKTLEGLADIPEAFGHGFGGTMKSIEQGFVNLLGDKQDRIDYAKKRYLEDNILYPTRTKGMATSGSEMVGGVAPYVISTAVLPETALLGHVIANGLTMGASGYGNGYYEMFAKQKQQGASDEEADAIAMQNAKFEGAKETAIGASLPFMGGAGSKLFLAPAEKSAMKQFLATQGVIIPTFTAGKLASNVYQKYGLGEKDVNLGDGLAETAENGLILGAMMEFAHKAPPKLKELYRANLSEQYPSIQQSVDKAVKDGVMDASQGYAFTEKLKRDFAVFNAMPKDITTEQKLAIEPEVKQIIELSSREPSAVESPEVTKDKIVQLQKQVAEKLGTPLTEKEMKSYEKLQEIKGDKEDKLTPSEKLELKHYEKRIKTAEENEVKLAEEKKKSEVGKETVTETVIEKGVEEPKVEVAKTEVETPTENMQDVGVEEHIDGDVGNLSIDEKIKYISDKTGINLRKSKNTNSWYGNINGKEVRISDHPSKFVERGEQQGVPAIDLNLEYLHHDAIVHLLNDTNPFENYKKGDKITHSRDKIGEVTYLDSDYKKGYVEVETKDGRVVKYDANKFLGNEYKEQPKSTWQQEQDAIDSDAALTNEQKQEKKVEVTAKALEGADKIEINKKQAILNAEKIDKGSGSHVKKMSLGELNELARDMISNEKYYQDKLQDAQGVYNLAVERIQELSESYHKAKSDGSNPELVEAVEDLLGKAPTQYTEAATPKEQAQKIADLTEKRDRDIAVASKPDVKLEFVSAKELVDSKDPIGNRNIHNDIKERFKKLKEILDCIHG